MLTILKMAYRNIWRNKSRTFITAGAVTFGVFLSILMLSFQGGTWEGIINGILQNYYGYAHVHQKGYWEDQSLDNSFEYTEDLKSIVESEKGVSGVIPRLEGFALVIFENGTQARQIVGTDPVLESKMSSLEDSVKLGTYLTPNDDGVLIADTLARELDLEVGDTLVFIGQGFRGANAAGKFPVRGIVKFSMPQMKEMIFMSLPAAQEFFAAEGRVTALVVNTDKPSKIDKTVSALQSKLDTASTYEVLSWEMLIPEILESKDLDEAGNKVVPFILYTIIGFVIFGTILMMLKEREYEFGVMNAIGMERWKMVFMVGIETLTINFIGVLMGVLFSLPIVYHFYKNPIPMSSMGDGAAETYEAFGIPAEIPFAFEASIFINEAITIFILSLVLSLVIFRKIGKLKAIEAMRH